MRENITQIYIIEKFIYQKRVIYRESLLSKKELYLLMASDDQKDWSRSLHEVRGSGSASRIRLNTGLLEEAGWKILSRESGNRVHFTYVDPEGKKFKSSKDVERKLEADGILDQFVNESSSEVASKVSSTSKDCAEESDEDYKPPLKKKSSEGHVKSG